MNGRKELPSRSFSSYFPHAVTEGGRGVCVAQTCTDARSACKTAHIGTTRPTPRSKRLRRCAFSDLCRSSAVNLPSGGGIGVRVFPASCVLVPKRDACVFFLHRKKNLRYSRLRNYWEIDSNFSFAPDLKFCLSTRWIS